MITEDPLEQLAIQWFQDTGWNHVHGAVIAPESVAAEREKFRAVVLKGRLAEAVRRLNPKLPESAVEEVVHGVTKPEHPLDRSFRAWNPVGDGTQGDALGCRMVPRWGGRPRPMRPSGARRRKSL